MPCTYQNAALFGAQRKDVARRCDIVGAVRAVDRHGDGARAVMGGNTGGDAFLGFNRHGERGFMARQVVRRHQIKAQIIKTIRRHRQANQALAVRGHEVDRIGRRHLAGDDQVTLILTILVVHQNEHPAITGLFDDFFGW